jgi:hypothetical protein
MQYLEQLAAGEVQNRYISQADAKALLADEHRRQAAREATQAAANSQPAAKTQPLSPANQFKRQPAQEE